MVAAAPSAAGGTLVLLLVLGIGVPVGVPPGPGDPMLYQVAPEQCLYYTTWAGMAKPEADSDNETERLLAEPELRNFLLHADRWITAMIQTQPPPEMVPLFQHGLDLAKIVLTQPAAFFVSHAQLDGEVPEIDAAMVVRLDESEAQVKEALEVFRRQMPGEAAEELEIGGAAFVRIQFEAQGPPILWGIHENYFILGIGQDSVAGVLQRRTTPAPLWLAELQDRLPVERQATLTYADMQGILHAILPLAGDLDPGPMLDALGVANITSMQSVTGLDQQRFVSRTLVEMDGPARGVLAALVEEPLTIEDLQAIPADAVIAWAGKLDSLRLFDAFAELIENVDPREGQGFREWMDDFAQSTGINLRDELLGSLGDSWRVYASPREGGVITGWTAAVTVRDRAAFNQAHNKWLAFFQNPHFGFPNDPELHTSEVNGHTMHTLMLPGLIAPSWSIRDDELLLALFPQALKAHLRRDQEQSLADVDAIAGALAGDPAPTVLGYQDTSALLEMVYPFVQIGAHQLMRDTRRTGVAMDLAQLPAVSSITAHLGPSTTAVRWTEAGLLLESHRTIPGASVTATAPIAIAMLLPAIVSAREAALRTQSVNNLRQIGLAWHNYHDVFNGLPAAYNTDEEGRPLLSWRVHILPFIEGQALYEQFRLDEPWDSEHNRRLIAQMPRVYEAPGSESGPGKTNYLAIAGEQYVMIPPREQAPPGARHANPVGISFRDVLDGTSNTIGVVEVSDELAVVWTKPDDYQPQQEDPIRGLVGLRQGIFNALLLDGSVRSISEAVDPGVLNALFTRAGGEPVIRPGPQPPVPAVAPQDT